MGYTIFYHKYVGYFFTRRNTLLYSSQVTYTTETVINVSRLINNFDHCYIWTLTV